MSNPLTDDQVAFFTRCGYLTVDALTDPPELDQIRAEVIRIFQQRAGRDVGDQFDLAGRDDDDRDAVLSQIMYPAKYAPALLDTELLGNATGIVRQLLGADAECGFEHAILKPAHYGVATPWHQDAAYWSPDQIHNTISIWVALQETTVDNGCLHYVPASHTKDVLSHQPIGNDPRTHGLELTDQEMHYVQEAVACPLHPGQATVHDGYTLHYAGANKTQGERIGLVLFGKALATPRRTQRVFPWQAIRQTARTARAAESEDKQT